MKKVEYSQIAIRKLKELKARLLDEYGTEISTKTIKQITKKTSFPIAPSYPLLSNRNPVNNNDAQEMIFINNKVLLFFFLLGTLLFLTA